MQGKDNDSVRRPPGDDVVASRQEGHAPPSDVAHVPAMTMGDYEDNASEDPLVGTDFVGRYHIDAVLGRGGMGAVYRATQIAVGRPVAIKVVRPELAGRAQMVARFRQEAELVANLHHPNIIALHDFGEDDEGRLFLVMELLAGTSLTNLLDGGTLLEPRRIAALLHQVLDALAEAHGRGIVHRDLKPDNLFIADGGRRKEVVKILDFGIAKLAKRPDDPGLTGTGVIIGSARYIAPEQARAQPVSNRTDLYAVGAILYEMIAGRPVFPGDSVTELLVSHCTETPAPLTRAGKAVSGVLCDLAMACLAKDPADRPASAEALLQILDATPPDRLLVFGRASDTALSTTPGGRPALASGRRWIWGAAALLVVGGGVGGVLLAGSGAAPETPAAAPSPAAITPAAPSPSREPDAATERDASSAASADTSAPDGAAAAAKVGDASVETAEAGRRTLTLDEYERLVLATADCKLENGDVDWRCPAHKALTAATTGVAYPEGRAELGRRLLEHPAATVRFLAVNMVASGRDATAVLPSAARAEPDASVLGQHLRALRNKGLEPAVGELFLWASRHADARVRREAVYGLTSSWNKGLAGATERLVELMNADPDDTVREAACQYAGALGDEVFLPTYKALTADRSKPALYGACMQGLIALWYDYPFFEAGSEKAYRLTLERLAKRPRNEDLPAAVPGRFASMASGFARWVKKNKWWNAAALRKVLGDWAGDVDAHWMARLSAIDGLVTHGATRAELEALRKACDDNEHLLRRIDAALAAPPK